MALYHKYRPQTFKDVIGQDHIVRTLSNQVSHNKVAHAYLFSGPRGVGKTTLARILAKTVNCENRKDGTDEPCNKCGSCEEISISRSIDVIEIDAASHTGVDNVRENIIDNAQFKPTKSKYKVFIIDEVHMLSTSAFNALLKTLEEPPGHVIFILATTELHKLPETIVSRCQRFNYHKVGHDTMKSHINNIAKAESIKVEKEVVERIVNKSDGCVRDAVSLLDQIMATGEKTITADVASLVLPTTNIEKTLEFVTALINKNLEDGLITINSLVNDGVNLPQFAHDTVELLRIMMVTKGTQKIEGLGIDLDDTSKKDLNKLNDIITHLDLVRLIDLMMKRSGQIKSAPLPQLPLEMVVIEWCSNQQSASSNQTSETDTKKIVTTPPSVETPKKEKVEKIEEEEVVTEAPKEIIEEEPIQKTTIKEKVKNLVTKSPTFSIEEVEEKWNEFLKKMEDLSSPIIFILKMATAKAVSGNTLQICVEFSFHQDKLNEKSFKDDMEKTLSEVLGTKAKIECLVEQSEKKQESVELQNLASSFGGEVVS